MDSVTQIALGAAVGGVIGHKQLGWRAYALGAALGTLPDLDVLVQYDNAVDNVTRHRGFSHSLFVLTALSPVLAWLIQRYRHWQQYKVSFWRMLLLCWLCLITHPLLDAFTSYGTQLLWPLQPPPTSWSSIFIIDPLYTLPLLIGVGFAMYWRTAKQPHRGYWPNVIGLSVASLYLAMSFGLAQHMRSAGQQSTQAQQLDGQLFVSPTPFNIALWRIVLVTENDWYSAYVSLFDDDASPQFHHGGKLNHQLGNGLADVERLAWFTNGFYHINIEDDQLVVTDLRLGVEPIMPFRFVVAQQQGDHWQPIKSEQLPTKRPRGDQLTWLWQRLRGQTNEAPAAIDYQLQD
ncbi:metal-dependent hydrolase [Neiella marina]|uniref:Metal-dependent hydrolase n=1 Tax=Neiella holothuriorum TaxID=2870530 RepID=A0ABS7EJQ6_9GAMM|nr:metal-dependent hydrolase [Neiella holothuriorum]MBW8192525.1 metal-dependent hydrolase [Neiella holothuriorum]